MGVNNLTFSSFNPGHQNIYIVQGCTSFRLYHIIQADEKDGKRKFLLFIPRGSLNITTRNWTDWRDCKKASYEVIEELDEDSKVIFDITFDVDNMFTKADHKVISARNEKEVGLIVDQTDMFIFDEEILIAKESVFSLKFKKEKTKGLGFKEIRSIIDINTPHILEQKTERVKTKFLANTGEEFLTKVQVVNKVGKAGKAGKEKKTVVKEAALDMTPAAAIKRSVDSKTVEPEVYISKRGRVGKKRS